jgi:hypothetical protein
MFPQVEVVPLGFGGTIAIIQLFCVANVLPTTNALHVAITVPTPYMLDCEIYLTMIVITNPCL